MIWELADLFAQGRTQTIGIFSVIFNEHRLSSLARNQSRTIRIGETRNEVTDPVTRNHTTFDLRPSVCNRYAIDDLTTTRDSKATASRLAKCALGTQMILMHFFQYTARLN